MIFAPITSGPEHIVRRPLVGLGQNAALDPSSFWAKIGHAIDYNMRPKLWKAGPMFGFDWQTSLRKFGWTPDGLYKSIGGRDYAMGSFFTRLEEAGVVPFDANLSSTVTPTTPGIPWYSYWEEDFGKPAEKNWGNIDVPTSASTWASNPWIDCYGKIGRTIDGWSNKPIWLDMNQMKAQYSLQGMTWTNAGIHLAITKAKWIHFMNRVNFLEGTAWDQVPIEDLHFWNVHKKFPGQLRWGGGTREWEAHWQAYKAAWERWNANKTAANKAIAQRVFIMMIAGSPSTDIFGLVSHRDTNRVLRARRFGGRVLTSIGAQTFEPVAVPTDVAIAHLDGYIPKDHLTANGYKAVLNIARASITTITDKKGFCDWGPNNDVDRAFLDECAAAFGEKLVYYFDNPNLSSFSNFAFFPGRVTCHTDHQNTLDKIIEQVKRPFRWASRVFDKYGQYAIIGAAIVIAAPALMAAGSQIAGGISSSLTSTGAVPAAEATTVAEGLGSSISTLGAEAANAVAAGTATASGGTTFFSVEGVIGMLAEEVTAFTGLPIASAVELVSPIVMPYAEQLVQEQVEEKLVELIGPEPVEAPTQPQPRPASVAEQLLMQSDPIVQKAKQTGSPQDIKEALFALQQVLDAADAEGHTAISEYVTELMAYFNDQISKQPATAAGVHPGLIAAGGAGLFFLILAMKKKDN